MLKQPLDPAVWSLSATGDLETVPPALRGRRFAAWVPSCVHTVLMRHGAIEDPYLGEGETLTRWIGLTDWEYRCTFDADGGLFDHERIDLACDGLDTVATVRLNDTVIGRSENMHVRHRFDSRGALRRGRNELVITLASPVRYALEHERRLGKLPYMTASLDRLPYNFIRKMACNFGWDWGPQLVTSGIWKGVRLEGWSGVRIKSAALHTIALRSLRMSHNADVRLLIETQSSGKHADNVTYSLEDHLGNGIVSGVTEDLQVRHDCDLTHVNPWWPLGHGAPALYKLVVATSADQITMMCGLRTIELDTSPDDIGRKFVVKVNGKPIFCKGFNWIPDDCFLDRANDSPRLRRRIQQAVDCGANMLRVWGGGIYETDTFYDLCDEMGVLVWQDFPFACAAYPEEEPFRTLVEEEARDNVARLAHHPSLVLWNGNNENLWGYHDWGWKKERLVEGRTWGPGYYFDVLPKVVSEVDPSRPYWAASPWSGDCDVDTGLHPNLETHGNKHVWEVWHGPGDYVNYRRFTPRFCSEFGFQGPPTFATLSRVMPPGEWRRDARQMAIRQKSPGGNERNDRIAAMYFDLPADFDDYLYLLQVMQARAVQCGVEWFRSRQPVCMGTLIWQLNDCWPVHSWAAIDGDGREKPLFHAARRFYAGRALTIQPMDGRHFLHAMNDTDEAWSAEATVAVRDFTAATPLVTHREEFAAPPRGQAVMRLPSSLVSAADPARNCLAAHAAGAAATAHWFFAADKEINYPSPAFDSAVRRTGGDTLELSIAARTLLRDLCVFPDRLDPDATVSDGMVTLLPGDAATFRIRSTQQLAAEVLTRPPVLNCVNRFGRRRG